MSTHGAKRTVRMGGRWRIAPRFAVGLALAVWYASLEHKRVLTWDLTVDGHGSSFLQLCRVTGESGHEGCRAPGFTAKRCSLMRCIITGCCALSVLVAGQSSAQPTDRLLAARDVKLGQAEPFTTVRALGAWGDPAEVLSFYVYWDKPYGATGRRRGFAVRRFSRRPEPQGTVRWATSHDCPAIEPLLLGMEEIPPPRIDVPVLGRDDRVHPPTDGVSYDLWSRWPSWPTSRGYALQMSSNVGSPLANWVQTAQRELAPCWREATPSAG